MTLEKGLYGKYRIYKTETGEELDGPAFVLRPDRDPAARKALWEYAKNCNYPLSAEITDWLYHICLENNIDHDYGDGHHFPWAWWEIDDYKRG